ncbi:hypothetical protein V500_10167 [Pseudogymnoascus sp. VKM F-4518 (FW-2643)]|nr:hypothetical protein V500_10167 [Pseudogymnoascus sp. VKM F-4518 (FW-2643)]
MCCGRCEAGRDAAAEGVPEETEALWDAPGERGGGEHEEELGGVEAEVVGEGGGGVGVAAPEEVEEHDAVAFGDEAVGEPAECEAGGGDAVDEEDFVAV